jgi:hypothetical protein
MSRCSIHVPYFGEEIYLRKVARLHMNMPTICVLQAASAAIYYLVFKTVIAALNELLFTNPCWALSFHDVIVCIKL